jgi:hypothetical protein
MSKGRLCALVMPPCWIQVDKPVQNLSPSSTTTQIPVQAAACGACIFFELASTVNKTKQALYFQRSEQKFLAVLFYPSLQVFLQLRRDAHARSGQGGPART